MKTGVILPTFRDDASAALEVARRAEAAGLDGVFCYDHLWPMGQPERPALAPFPVLAAVAATTDRVAVGTLVARVGLVPDDVLMAEVAALEAIAPGRVVIALGTGDHLSAAENRAYGVAFPPADARRATLRRVAAACALRGVGVWIGGGAPATVAVAEEDGVAVNLWNATPEELGAQAARTEVTWAGPSPGEPAAGDDGVAAAAGLRGLLDRLRSAGATWAVLAWPAPLDVLGRAGGAGHGGGRGGK